MSLEIFFYESVNRNFVLPLLKSLYGNRYALLNYKYIPERWKFVKIIYFDTLLFY